MMFRIVRVNCFVVPPFHCPIVAVPRNHVSESSHSLHRMIVYSFRHQFALLCFPTSSISMTLACTNCSMCSLFFNNRPAFCFRSYVKLRCFRCSGTFNFLLFNSFGISFTLLHTFPLIRLKSFRVQSNVNSLSLYLNSLSNVKPLRIHLDS